MSNRRETLLDNSCRNRALIRIRLIECHGTRGGTNSLNLLTPGGNLVWGRCVFEHNPAHGNAADYYIVLYNARPVDQFICAPENTLFIAGEPASKKIYPEKFYRQFYRVIDTHKQSNHPRVEVTALGLPWFAGLNLANGQYQYGYDYLAALVRGSKQNKISVICSDAAFTPGQRLRLEFLHALKHRLGDRMVHFGRGFEPIRDKLDGILPYRLHLVLENSEAPHYWTEKLADAYLGWAFPLYVGCPNLEQYFDPRSFLRLNPHDVEGAACQIESLLATPSNAESELVAAARLRVLNVYNPLAWCARWVEEFYQEAPQERLTIRSHKAFRPFPRGLLFRCQHRK